MKLTEICIQRPVLATVLSLALVVVGVVTFGRLQVRHYPRIEQPRISINTRLDGASPDIIETNVTKILEDQLSGIEGVEAMTSSSEAEQSRITLVFKADRDIDGAANDVRDRLSRVRNKLPQDVQNPQISKADADAVPMFYLVLYSDRHDLKDVADYAHRTLENQLEAIGGVATVDIWGGGEYSMYVRLDPTKLAAYRLTAEDVSNALKHQNIDKPAGKLITQDREIVVTTKASLKTEEDFRQVVIAERDGYLVRIADVATVKFDAIDKQFRVRFNGREAVALAITRQSVANPLSISQDIRNTLPRIRENLPQGMHIDVAYDQSVFIDRSIDEVYETIAEATFLVILVIFLFLRSFRASIVPVVTIPLSLIGTFSLMYAFGFTVNVLTLLALVMAIGLVVDDAIVMLENIYRYIEKGMAPMEAALKGAKEISFAVVAMTITLAAVYAPISLTGGTTGKVFTEFALTLAGAVILSGFIALTLSPMMCSRFLRHHHVHSLKEQEQESPFRRIFSKIDFWIEETLHKIDTLYDKLLRKALKEDIPLPLYNQNKQLTLKARFSVVIGAILIAGLGGYFGFKMKQDLSPAEDQGFVKARAFPPQGANLDYIDKYMRQGEKILAGIPEVDRVLTLSQAPGDPVLESYLVPWEKRKRSSVDIAQVVRPQFSEITGMSFAVSGRGRSLIGGGGGSKPIELNIQTTKSYDELITIFKDFVATLGKIPGIDENNIEDTLSADEQSYFVTIDREKAALLNVEVSTIAEMLDTMISGRPATYFKSESHRYPVTVELAEKFRRTRDDISSIYMRAVKDRKEVMIPLSELVTVEKQLVPTLITHTSGLRSVKVEAELKAGYGLGETLQQIKQEATRVLPEGSKVELAGESKRFQEESSNILLIFALAILSIYLVLSAQYESFLDPLIIMMSVPLSLVGGLVFLAFGDSTLKWSGIFPDLSQSTLGTLTIFGKIGLVTLIGLITKHGILIVDFANLLLPEKKNDRFEAVIQASRLRLRPILMTTFAMVLGAVPLAFAEGAGAESRRQIGLVIVGGMSIGTLFTLFVIPAVYTYISRDNLNAFVHKIVKMIGLGITTAFNKVMSR